jgi:hypothetical protein
MSEQRRRRRRPKPPRMILLDTRQLADLEADHEKQQETLNALFNYIQTVADTVVQLKAEIAVLGGQVHRAENLASILAAELEKRRNAAKKANLNRRMTEGGIE